MTAGRDDQDDPADAAQLRAAAGGDATAVSRLYAAHVDALYAFAFYRAGRDPALAEDIVHDTLLDALRHAGQFDPSRGDLRTFLLLRLRNVARSHLRDHHRSRDLASAWDQREATLAQIFQSLEGAPAGDELLARAETRELVHLAIAGLADNHRVALTRKYVHGDSLQLVGARLGLSEDAAKSLLARARRAFRDAFSALRPAPESTSTGRPSPALREVRNAN